MSPVQTKALEDLHRIFGEDFGTAQVLATPSSSEQAFAVEAAESELDIDLLIRDLAIIAARETANVLESHAMRAADYADLPDVWQSVLDRIKTSLDENPGTFVASFQEHLRARG